MFTHKIEPDIVMRLFERRHAAELCAFFTENREHLGLELPWLMEPFNEGDVGEYIQAGLDRLAANQGFRAGIWQRGALAGCVSLHGVDWNDRKASLGYWVGQHYQGRGLVTQCLQAVIAHAFDDLGLERLEILCAADNERSRKMALRLGFQEEGVLRRSWLRQGQWVDQVVHSRLRERG